MHVVKIGDRYLGLVDSQTQALRMPDAEDGRVLTGALLAATVKNGDNLPEGRPVLLTTRAMRAARARQAVVAQAEPDQLEAAAVAPNAAPPLDLAGMLMDVRDSVFDAFNAAIDRLVERLAGQ